MKDGFGVGRMQVIGITGGIGTGKSEVGRILSELGGKVIDSDDVYREIARRGQPAYDEIISVFGNKVVAEDGELDRKKLAGIVFKNKDMLLKLNAVTHKHVLAKIHEEICELKMKQDFKFIAIEVPIPVKDGFLNAVDAVWTIRSDVSLRMSRIMDRSGLNEAKARNIINSQMSDKEYDEIADVTIMNNGSKDGLKAVVVEELRKRGIA